MKITKISQQVKQTDRYSVFIDEKYAFSLSQDALLKSNLASGQTLTDSGIEHYKQLSADDKVYGRALRYIAVRPRSIWEMEMYLRKKQAPDELMRQLIEKLTVIGLLNDHLFAEMFVRNRRLLKPSSHRKLTLELRNKRISPDIITDVLGHDSQAERSALQAVIIQKRRQIKYQDELTLMQYLARQGFGYSDIKTALANTDDTD
jgi:regulatory protein